MSRTLASLIDTILLTSNHSSRRGNKIRYIVIHWVGAKSSAKNNLKYFASGKARAASAHFFVDSKIVGQSVAINRAAWSIGDRGRGRLKGKATNQNSISIELCCVYKRGKLIVDPKAIAKARALVMTLMELYGIPESRVIRHYDVTGKTCPGGYIRESNWIKLHDYLTGVTDVHPDKTQWAKYRVVVAPSVAVRRSPGVKGSYVYSLKKGSKIYVHQSRNGWGRIHQSWNRWVWLGNTKPR